DGKADMVVANAGSGNVAVISGKGDGTFEAPVNYAVGSNPGFVLVADFNADGRSDVAVANPGAWVNSSQSYTNSRVAVLLGKGDGTFLTAVNYAGVSPDSVAVGDFNGDGKPDLAVADGDGTVAVRLGKGDGTFQSALNYGAGVLPRSVTVGDFNGDGKPDL